MKFQKLCSLLCAGSIMLSLMATAQIAAFAELPVEKTAEGEPYILIEDGEFDFMSTDFSEELYALRPGNVFSGTSYFTQLDSVSQEIYKLLYEAYRDGGHGEKVDILSAFLESGCLVGFEDRDALKNEIRIHITPAVAALSLDHPELSWLSSPSYSWGMNYIITESGINLTKLDFFMKEGFYQFGTKAEMDYAAALAESEIGIAPNQYEQVRRIHDYLCLTVDYNYTVVENTPTGYNTKWYQTAYSAFYPIAENGETSVKTVCAGYSKAFKFLCDRYGIPCVMVSGVTESGGAHAWNYVKMPNGAWYAVDVTWDDQTNSALGIVDEFFLVGKKSVPVHFAQLPFQESHVEVLKKEGLAYPVLSLSAYDVSAPLIGDIDGNNSVNVLDARRILQHIVGEKSLTEEESARADVKADGNINVLDARQILQIVVGAA